MIVVAREYENRRQSLKYEEEDGGGMSLKEFEEVIHRLNGWREEGGVGIRKPRHQAAAYGGVMC